MQDNPQLPPGTPSPINITLADSFGGQKQEEIKIDSNRLGTAGDRRYHWAEDLNIPARSVDIWLQAGAWVAGSAFTASLLRSFPLVVEVVAPLVVVLLVAIACGAFAFSHYADLRLFIVYRVSLIICGVCLGALLWPLTNRCTRRNSVTI
jgi:hypothetical protein